MDITTVYEEARAEPPVAIQPESLCGRLIELFKHLERQGHVSPVDTQLMMTLVHHPEMPRHLKSEGSRPTYPLSEGYDGPVKRYLA